MASKNHTKRIYRKKRNIGQKVFGFIKGFDFYGKNIVLTYKGDDKFRTHVGGVASVIVGGIVAVYIFLLVKMMFQKDNTSYVKSSLLNDILTSVDLHFPAENDVEPDTGNSQFDFAFQFTVGGADYMNDPTAFSFEMNLVEQEWINVGGTSTRDRNKTSLNIEK